LNEFQEILKSDPKSAAACRGLGYSYLQRGDFGQAAEFFKRASKLDSKDPRVHYYSALLMVRESGFGRDADLAGITAEVETSISLDPTFADSYALLAFAQSTAGDPGKAIESMRKALAISPRNHNYIFNLANFYLAYHQPDQAIALLQALRAANDPELASRVSESLAQAQQFQHMQQMSSDEPGAAMVIPLGDTSETGADPEDKAQPSGAITTGQSNAGAAKFIRGTLADVDCSKSPLAILTVISGSKTWKMNVADRNHLVLIGADQFSCNWRKQKVALNYRETSDGRGNVFSLEIQ